MLSATSLFYFFGYFPVISEKPRRFTSILLYSPLAVTFIITALSIAPLAYDFTKIKQRFSTVANSNYWDVTVYLTLITKSMLHIFCALFIKIGMLRNKQRVSEIYRNLQYRLRNLASFSELRSLKRSILCHTVAYVLFATILCLDIYRRRGMNGEPWNFTAVFCFPIFIGYFNTVFAFVAVYHLQGFSICLKRIKAAKEYEEIVWEVKQFLHVYGLWITLDVVHSFLRILFSSYFVVNHVLEHNLINAYNSLVVNDACTITLYCYVLILVCQSGSRLQWESEISARRIVDWQGVSGIKKDL